MPFNHDYLESFAGFPIEPYEPNQPILDDEFAIRVDVCDDENFDGEITDAEDFYATFFESDGLENVKALIFGCWTFDGEGDVFMIVDPLIKNADRLPNLRALFIGDVTAENCEGTWLEMDDISGLWDALPQLEIFWLRGSNNLTLGDMQHENLRELVLQSDGFPRLLLGELFQATLPNLEHLELWLGEKNYGGDTNAKSFRTLFSGEIFPKLKYLGLRNSEYADDIAKAIVHSPILQRLEVLDLSEGTLGDEGAKAILASPKKFAHLKMLDLHHHYIYDEILRMRTMPCKTDLSEPTDEISDGRYISTSE